MTGDYFKIPRRSNYYRRRRPPPYENSRNGDPLPETSTSTSTRRSSKSSTEVLIGIEQKSEQVTDWFPVLSILLAAMICLIVLVVLCKQHIDHRRYITLRENRRRTSRNKNNNQTSASTVDVAECIDDEIDFVEGLEILLAKGSLVLNGQDARLLNSMSAFDRLRYFQKLANHLK